MPHQFKQQLPPGTAIPRPRAQPYTVVRWATSRGEEALVYRIPMRAGSKKSSEKRLPISALVAAEQVLTTGGEISRSWFRTSFPELELDGSCNFIALGGALEVVGLARYAGPGVYTKI